MTLAESLREYIAAAFTGVWIESHEHEDALSEISRLCRQESGRLAVWDLEQGLRVAGTPAAADAGGSDPLAAIRSVNGLAAENSSALLVLTNFHRFLQSAEIVQALAKQLAAGKQNRTFVIVLSPVVQIPTELEKLFIVVEHPLPGRDQLEEIARGVATDDGEMPTGVELRRLLDAAAGLTRFEAENAYCLSLVRHKRLQVETLWELKSQVLKKSGLLTLHRGGERFDDLGGLEALKTFCKRALRGSPGVQRVKPRGVLLLSPPGCGKSQFCKALGNESGRPTLVLDVGSLLGSLVGQSEANIRQALRIVDAMAPAVCFLDEVKKAFSGVSSSGQTDSGVSARLFGSFLSWLNDHESDVFVVAKANDITNLPPEFSRAERFDSVFFLDLPDAEQRTAIWRIYMGQYRLDAQQTLPSDGDWTGAEIHPHVSEHTLCEGDGAAPIRSALSQGRLLDFFVLVHQILQTYNDASAHVTLDDWDGVKCSTAATACLATKAVPATVVTKRCVANARTSAQAATTTSAAIAQASALLAGNRSVPPVSPSKPGRAGCSVPPASKKKLMTKPKTRRQKCRQSHHRKFRRNLPPLRLTPYAWAKLLHLRDFGETEVGGFGVSAPGDLLLVADVVLVRQQCSPVTVKFDDSAVADYFDRQVDTGRTPEQFGRIWIHTHPGDCPQPSYADEETFARCFGSADWAVMFIVARGGQTYVRLRFNAGPSGDLLLPVEIEFQEPFAASDWAAWEEEYCSEVVVEREPPRMQDLPRSMAARERWPDDFGLWSDPFFDPFYVPDHLEHVHG